MVPRLLSSLKRKGIQEKSEDRANRGVPLNDQGRRSPRRELVRTGSPTARRRSRPPHEPDPVSNGTEGSWFSLSEVVIWHQPARACRRRGAAPQRGPPARAKCPPEPE